MNEKRETILRLTQDATGRIIDAKVEQVAVSEPKYVFEITQCNGTPSGYDSDISLNLTGEVMSYKTIGDDETIIPVSFTVNGETVTPRASGRGDFSVRFNTADMEPDPEHPERYEFIVHLVQEESGKTRTTGQVVTTSPYLQIPGKPSPMSYTGNKEQTLDIVLKHALYKDLVVLYDGEETAKWLHASIVGSKLRITCEKNPSPKKRSGIVTVSLADRHAESEPVTVTQEGAEVKILVFPSSITDGGLTDDKSRRRIRLRVTITYRDQQTNEVLNPDVPWTITGSDERVVVESVDKAKRELLLSLDASDTLEEPVSVTFHLEDGSNITMPYPFFKEDLTPSDK